MRSALLGLCLLLPAGARADDLTLELRLAPLDPLPPEPAAASWEPLWRVPADSGAVFPWVPAGNLLGVARFHVPADSEPAPAPSQLRLDGAMGVVGPAAQAVQVFPAGAPLRLNNPHLTPLAVSIDGAAPVTVPAGDGIDLPDAVWAAPGWHHLRASEGTAEWRVLMVEPPFAVARARLAGPGRLLMDFGNVPVGGAEPVTIQLELWLDGEPVCPAESDAECQIVRSAIGQDGRIVLEPVEIGGLSQPGSGDRAEP